MNAEKIREVYLAELTALSQRPRVPPPRNARNLVLGFATNLDKAGVEVFVTSLRRTGYEGEIVLFLTKLDPELEAFCRERTVTVARAFNTLFSPFHPTFVRFSHYYDYLTSRLANGYAYDRVFLSDVSDVVFQENPFEAFAAERLTLFFESGVTIGECPANGSWLRSAFGEAELAKLSDKPISCSGTTMGPVREVQEYLIKMLLGATNADMNALMRHGVDQSVHNYLIHNGWLGDFDRSENGDVVLTLHYHLVQQRDLFVAADGRICDRDRRIIPVVHQYNRSADLTEHYRRMYAAAA